MEQERALVDGMDGVWPIKRGCKAETEVALGTDTFAAIDREEEEADSKFGFKRVHKNDFKSDILIRRILFVFYSDRRTHTATGSVSK